MREFEILYDMVANPVIPENITRGWLYTEVRARLMLENSWHGKKSDKELTDIIDGLYDGETLTEGLRSAWDSWRAGEGTVSIIGDVIAGALGVLDPTGIVSAVHAFFYYRRGQYIMTILTALGAIPKLGSFFSAIVTKLTVKRNILSAIESAFRAVRSKRVLARSGKIGHVGRRKMTRIGRERTYRSISKAKRNVKRLDQQDLGLVQNLQNGLGRHGDTAQRFFKWSSRKMSSGNIILRSVGKMFSWLARSISSFMRALAEIVRSSSLKGGAARHGIGTVINPSDARWEAGQSDSSLSNRAIDAAAERIPGLNTRSEVSVPEADPFSQYYTW